MTIVEHNPGLGYTFRTVSPAKIDAVAITTAQSAVDQVARELRLAEGGHHAFVTMVPGGGMTTDPDGEPCPGLYMSGIQAVTVVGTQPPCWDRERWLQELRITVAHELYHYHQEVMGIEIDEDEAESFAQGFATVQPAPEVKT